MILIMKRLFFTLVLAVFATAAWAQDTPKKPSFAGFVSNGFWDNWEISVGAGAGTALSNGADMGSKGDRIGFEGNFSLTKWIHPVIGMRAQLQGGWFNNFDAAGKHEWPYMFVHGDFMLNFSNWVGGYREDRAYYAVPFVGMGYMATNITDKSKRDNGTGARQNFVADFGLLNKFRISPSFDFNIELKGLISPSRIAPLQMPGSYLFGFSATAGFTYRFNKRGWERGVAGYTADDIQAFQDAVAVSMAAVEDAEEENALLSNQLQAARAEANAAKAAAAAAERAAAAAKAEAKVKTPAATALILYDYSMSKLTPKDKTRLELTAELIKSGPKDKVYKIQGHADQQTGSKDGNRRVAQNRARNVYDFLVSKGVNPKQLTYEGLGNEKDIFNIQDANRAVIIK